MNMNPMSPVVDTPIVILFPYLLMLSERRPTYADSLHIAHPSSDSQSKDLANIGTVRDSRLPWRTYGRSTINSWLIGKSIYEGRKCEERANLYNVSRADNAKAGHSPE